MASSEHADDPLHRVGRLIAVALDPHGYEAERDGAWHALRTLPAATLWHLASDPRWQHVLAVIEGDGDIQPTDDESWARTDAARNVESGPPPPTAALHRHTQDLRWLVGDDYRSDPLLVPRRGSPTADAVALLALGASAAPATLVGTADVARRLPWAAMNHGPLLGTLCEVWHERPEFLEAFLHERFVRRADRGVPPRLAVQLHRVISGDPATCSWFGGLASWVEAFLDAEILDFLGVDDLAGRHLGVRVEIARRVRAAEITDAALISGVELWATVRLLRTAAARDLSRVWHTSERRVADVPQSYHALLQADDLLFDRAFRAILVQPDAASLRQLSRYDLQAMAMARGIRAGCQEGDGGILDPDEWEH